MRRSPEVSVVIPTRSGREFLPLTLASALGQEDVNVEVILVDDNPSGNGAGMTFARLQEPRLRVIHHGANRGVGAARNTGLAYARAEWIALLDDDDLWSPRKLRTQLEAAAAQDASFVYGAAVIIDEHGHPLEADLPPPDPSELPRALLAWNRMPAPGSNLLARTDLLRRLGGFDERARFDDWDMWIRLGAAGRAARCSGVLIGYRRHRSNRILRTQHEALPGLAYMAQKHRALSRRYEVDFDLRKCRHWVAWAYRRAGHPLRASRTCLGAAWAHRSAKDVARAGLVLLGAWGVYGPRPPPRPAEPEWLGAFSDGAPESGLRKPRHGSMSSSAVEAGQPGVDVRANPPAAAAPPSD
jgi:glycosyltransferase involved in cell wall biosynthesis